MYVVMKFLVKEKVLGLPVVLFLCLMIILYFTRVLMAFEQVFLEPTPMACSAARGIVNRLEIICGGCGLFSTRRLSTCLCSNRNCARAKMRVDCAGGLRSVNSLENSRPFGRTLKVINSSES